MKSVYEWSWFWKGVGGFGSLPSIVLVSAFIGFGGLARDAGITFGQLMFMVPLVWALPSLLILVAGIAANASLVAIALAVTLASLRMLPMVMAFVPEVRVPGTKRWHLVAASNLVAITAWVNLMQHSSAIPRAGRLPYFSGFGITMVTSCTIAAGAVHQLAAGFPTILMALFTFLTPLYFSMSIWNASRLSVERVALGLGIVFLPLAYWATPQFAILIAGIGAGLMAFAVHLFVRKRT